MKKTSLIVGALLIFGIGVWGNKWLQGVREASATQERTERVVNTASAASNPQRPPFALPDTAGISRHIKTWDGKVLVINFWATWCAPCLREIPVFIELQKKYGAKGVQFVGVAFDDMEAIQGFTNTAKIRFNYPILIGEDEAMTIAATYGNVIGALPYTVIVNRQGKIIHGQIGEISRRSAEDIIKPLL